MEDRDKLLQEKHIIEDNGPWRVLVTCMMLNQTTWVQAEPVLEEIFERWPGPEYFTLRIELYAELEGILKPLGLNKIRATRLIKMSQQYSMLRYVKDLDVTSLYGCGPYAADAWSLFVLKEACNPSDRLLKKYAKRVGLIKT